MTTETKMYQLSEEQLNAVLQYLGSRPYNEVHNFVNLLVTAMPVKSLDELLAEQDGQDKE